MSTSVKTYEEHIEDIKGTYYFYVNEAMRLLPLLRAAGVEVDTPPAGQSAQSQPQTTPSNNSDNHNANGITTVLVRGKFEKSVMDALRKDEPLSVRELMSAYHKVTGILLERRDMASRVNKLSKEKEQIKSVELKELPNGQRFWWCLSGWFTGGKLNKEYIDKIYKKANYSADPF